MRLSAGDWVEVRSKEEILRSLDPRGRLDELPFMPQMFQYCGQRFRVYKRAHKTCDTVEGTGGRWLADGVHLDLRCDGKAHGGCQAGCLIFWKESWLKPIRRPGDAEESASRDTGGKTSCTEENIWRATRVEGGCPGKEERYVCQATQLPYFTTLLRWWDIRQYIEDYWSANASLGRLFAGLFYAGYYTFCHPVKRNRLWGPTLRWLYDWVQARQGGVPYPRRPGTVPTGQSTPACTLNLQPGELVRVKPYKDILATLDAATNKNRGMAFDAELVPYCGGQYRVKTQVSRFIDEKTGRMSRLKTPAVILENVWCQSRYSPCRAFCPRSIYSWWREAWLERVSVPGTATSWSASASSSPVEDVPVVAAAATVDGERLPA
jgi:hypothetical protein